MTAPPAANPLSRLTTWWLIPQCSRGRRSKVGAAPWAALRPWDLPVPIAPVPSYQITDARVHALVGDGAHGQHERRETLRCQACATSFSTRRGYPLGDAALPLKTASHRVAEVLTALAEGLSVAAAVRVFGHRHATITTWLTRAGRHSATLHERVLRQLHLPHIQLHELRSRLRNRTHTLWLWLALDPLTKIIAVLHHPEGTRCAHPGGRSCRRP